MIGVIIWSNAKERKAVVWCEDQGDLAFLGCDETRVANLGNLEVGEMLQFDIEVEGDIRRVRNAILLHNYARIDIKTQLDAAAQMVNDSAGVQETRGKILTFPRPTPIYAESDDRAEIAI